MKKTVIFSGTAEGRILSEGLSRIKTHHFVCVATHYGSMVMQPNEYCKIIEGRMDEKAMEDFIVKNAERVFDATHPYALLVTENISKICQKNNIKHTRVIRASHNTTDENNIINFKTHAGAADFLKNTSGNILLTTGSKDIHEYTGIQDLKHRIFARVLPSEESLRLLEKNGIKTRQIIAMQGPFSVEMNLATIRQYNIKWLVTKESGRAGGFEEKCLAALQADAGLIVISRSRETEGEDVYQVMEELRIPKKLEVDLIGMGPGEPDMMTAAAQKALSKADIVFGAKRLLEIADKPGFIGEEAEQNLRNVTVRKYPYYLASDVIPAIKQLAPHRAAVLFSGDSGFFSGTAAMKDELLRWADNSSMELIINIIPGISSVSMLAARLKESYDDYPIVSLHGKSHDDNAFFEALDVINNNKKTFLLFSGRSDVIKLMDLLKSEVESSQKGCQKMILGYNLSYPDEKIYTLDPTEAITPDQLPEGLYTGVVKRWI